MKKIIYMLFSFFILIGIVFIVSGIHSINSGIKKENRVYVNAKIEEIYTSYDSDGDEIHSILVSYMVGDEEYRNKFNEYKTTYYVGKYIRIYYDKTDPQKIESDGFRRIRWLSPIMGTAFVLFGIIPIAVMRLKEKSKKKLLETGIQINAHYLETILDDTVTVNDQHPYNIVCEWTNPNDGQVYTFESEDIWYNPEEIIKLKHIEYFKVYIDSYEVKKYVVDTSNLE